MFLQLFPIRFNSTTVQLIHYDGFVEGENKNRFNSTTVQLIQ